MRKFWWIIYSKNLFLYSLQHGSFKGIHAGTGTLFKNDDKMEKGNLNLLYNPLKRKKKLDKMRIQIIFNGNTLRLTSLYFSIENLEEYFPAFLVNRYCYAFLFQPLACYEDKINIILGVVIIRYQLTKK